MVRENSIDELLYGPFIGHVDYAPAEAGRVRASYGLQVRKVLGNRLCNDQLGAFFQKGQTHRATESPGAAGY